MPYLNKATASKLGVAPGMYSQKAINQMSAKATKSAKAVKQESEESIRAKLKERFDTLSEMATATAFGKNRSLIVSGPPGLGKSFTAMKAAEEAEKANKVVIIVKGFVRPTGLYRTLYENKFKDCLIVFDDADSIFADDICLNILKTACDCTEKRRISWLAETRMLDEEGGQVPRRFDFEGSVLFITNKDFDALIDKGDKLSPHLEALVSRSHYLDLAMKTNRDYIVRIKQVLEDGMLDDTFTKDEQAELMAFIEKYQDQLRELSLRMVIKLGGLMKMTPNWKERARITCMKQKQTA